MTLMAEKEIKDVIRQIKDAYKEKDLFRSILCPQCRESELNYVWKIRSDRQFDSVYNGSIAVSCQDFKNCGFYFWKDCKEVLAA